MPTETQTPSQSHRPSLANHRSTSSIHSQQTDSPSSTPPTHNSTKTKHTKHVVGGHHHHHAPRMHARIPSSKSMQHIVSRNKSAGGSSTDNLKKLGRNQSATNVRKNNSHVSLKRNQSSGDVSARSERGKSKERAAMKHAGEERRASQEVQKSKKERGTAAGVHFEMGDEEEDDGEDEEDDKEEGEEGENDGWEEASSSASPALSRSASRPNSAKQSANNSEPHSPTNTTFKSAPTPSQPSMTTNTSTDGTVDRQDQESRRPQAQQTQQSAADAKIITERLLQRVPSHHTTKMSLATATPSQSKPTTPLSRPSDDRSRTTESGPNSNGTSQYGSKEEIISRFVSGSGTPHDQSYLSNRTSSSTSPSKHDVDQVKRAQSMGNLSRRDSSRLNSEREDEYEESDRPLAPKTRSRKSSTGNAYTPPHTSSRTQQKLMLQRASSNIDPQNLAHPPLSLGMAALGLGYAGGGVGGLVGSGVGYDGRDPRIKAQLDRTGLEYLVVRRHKDPVGVAIKRLDKLPGASKNRKIPASSANSTKLKNSDSGRKSGTGLSQSLTTSNGRKSMDSGTTGSG